MAVKLQHPSFVSSSSSNPWLSRISIGSCISCKKAGDLNYLKCNRGIPSGQLFSRPAFLEEGRYGPTWHPVASKRNIYIPHKTGRLLLLAAAEEGVTVNGTPQASTGSNVEEMRVKLAGSMPDEGDGDGLVQSLHDAARNFELAIKENSTSKLSWFSAAWLGVDRTGWVKILSYQASVYSLLQAAIEISMRGDSGDRDTNLFVQRSFVRQATPLESMIRDRLLARQPEVYDWFFSEQVPTMVKSFVDYIEADPRFIAVITTWGKGNTLAAGSERDVTLLMLALTCVAAIMKLGPAKISCSQFISTIPDLTGRLMDMLIGFIPISKAYNCVKNIGLCREFLLHFGPRAAACRVGNDRASDEVHFWVDLVQKQLQRAIDREKIWSRLTTFESIEVLEKDLAIFGFFIALGRRTESFLFANGFDSIDDPIEDFVRYLIGGSVLYYPQLSSISSYQLYVEVVCEELEWIPFYPRDKSAANQKLSHGHKSKTEVPANYEAIPQVLDVCSHWLQSLIKYSKWLDNPSNVKAARFLSRGHIKLSDCVEELGLSNRGMSESKFSGKYVSASDEESNSFDKALESVDEALVRLEKLLQQLHVSSSYSGKEQIKAACSDLEKIRKLKKEAEYLEASFRAKTASLQQEDDQCRTQPSIEDQEQHLKGKSRKKANVMLDRGNRTGKNRGLWSFLTRFPNKKAGPELSEKEYDKQPSSNLDIASEPSEIRRFELLRNELIELEKRVQRSTDQSENEEEISITSELPNSDKASEGIQLVQTQKKESVIDKTLDKLKETSSDVIQGTQLLAVDVAAAMGLLRRSLIGDELTEKEKKALRRTMTDLASVIPIGVLMLLPVTAVGHAAMLAAIQRYVPALIPSTYGPERLNLLRQLEKVKEMQTSETEPEESDEELA